MYKGTINLDYTGADNNAYAKLVAALLALDWRRVETSAFLIETEDVNAVLVGAELVAKQTALIGLLSAFTFHVQFIQDVDGLPYAAAENHPYAVEEILGRPSPRPRPRAPLGAC